MPDQPDVTVQTATRPAEPPYVPLGSLVEDLERWLGNGQVWRHDPTDSSADGADRSGHSGPADDVVVSGMSLSSRRVRPGDLYAALPGSRAHGATFVPDAVGLGAVAVLTDPTGADRCAGVRIPLVVVEDPRAVLGRLAARVYGDPARDLRLVAVTGTQGKTTTTRLAEAALQASGVPAAVVGTVGTRIDGVDVRSSLTTPEAPDLHALFAVMRERGVRGCAMEVSSHALVMGRVDGVVFDLAVFTNLGRDHLDFHADVEDYFAAKASLFTPERARAGLVNIDDEHGRRLLSEARIPMRTFSARGRDHHAGAGAGDAPADWWVSDVRLSPSGSTFTIHGPDGTRYPAGVPLAGDFNVSNALAAVAALTEVGFDGRAVAAAVAAGGGVPGRLEQVDAGQNFVAVVDYAHKPDAVAAALAALRPVTRGRLVIVLGAGGERDAGKRPIMGEIAARLADVLVVTDDNPRGEDPAAIRSAILAGAREVPEAERALLHEAGDRREAIRLAVSTATAGDTVVIAGKGHESGQEVDGEVLPFDDRQVLREELSRR